MMRSGLLRLLPLLCLAAGTLPAHGQAAALSAADTAWIDTCIAQRKSSGETPARLRAYCTCMQEVVDDNEPFENATALERTYPPMHQACRRQAARK